MDSEKQLIISALGTKDLRLFYYSKGIMAGKNDARSIKERMDADTYYHRLNHDCEGHKAMLSSYSNALAYAKPESETLALAYLRRAMYFLHLNKRNECLFDTDRALDITKSSYLKVQLYCIRIHCYNTKIERKAVLKKARFLLNKLDNSVKEKDDLKVILDNLEIFVEDTENLNLGQTNNTIEENEMDIEDILSKKEAENIFKSITIRYNEKDGRHLVAARNIKAGEIITVVKPYAIHPNIEISPYMYCCHCVKITWNCIPCNNCTWCFFCSEKCRDEAWQLYHDVECMTVLIMRHVVEYDIFRQLTVRTLLTAVRQAGGIPQLRKELEEVDKCTNTKTRGFSNGKFENDKFISLYSLMNVKSTKLTKSHVHDAAKLLVIFAKFTNLFGRRDRFKLISEIPDDEDAVFIGSLILRLFGIFSINYQEVSQKNASCEDDQNICFGRHCCYRASLISPLFSLINHNCNPNAAVFYTDANKLMLVALKPIKKKTQIYQSYSGCRFYFDEKKIERQITCHTVYHFGCDCEACKNNWPLLENMNQDTEKLLPNIPQNYELVGNQLEQINNLLTRIKENTLQYNEATLQQLGNAIEVAKKNYVEPSFTINTLVKALATTYKKLYLKEFKFPHKCSNIFNLI